MLIVVIVLALLVGCRQQCLPPRLCRSRVGVAFSFSSVRCSPPSSYPVGRQRCLPPCPLCPPPAVFCPCPVLAVLASRLVGVGLGQVGPSPCLSAFVLPLLPYLLACLPFAGRRPHHHFAFGKTSRWSASPGLALSPSPSLLVSWVGGLSSGGVGFLPPASVVEEQLNIVMHRIWSYRLGVCFPQSPYQIQYKHQRPNSL